MLGLVARIAVSSLVTAQAYVSYGQAQMGSKPATNAEAAEAARRIESAPGDLPLLPPVPHGNSTVMGGDIRTIDPVRDQLTLRIAGEKQMKILFDERTHIYRDGVRIPIRELKASSHASIQTTLDGSDVFALSIHILSQAPEGEYEGRILNFDPVTRMLTVEGGSGEPLKLKVSTAASVARTGPDSFVSGGSGASDLRRGSLASVRFEAGTDGTGVANKISILAVPGSSFIFGGVISALDIHEGFLVLVDPRDGQDYRIFFDSLHTPAVPPLHDGQSVRITAEYNGTHYVASEIAASK